MQRNVNFRIRVEEKAIEITRPENLTDAEWIDYANAVGALLKTFHEKVLHAEIWEMPKV